MQKSIHGLWEASSVNTLALTLINVKISLDNRKKHAQNPMVTKLKYIRDRTLFTNRYDGLFFEYKPYAS